MEVDLKKDNKSPLIQSHGNSLGSGEGDGDTESDDIDEEDDLYCLSKVKPLCSDLNFLALELELAELRDEILLPGILESVSSSSTFRFFSSQPFFSLLILSTFLTIFNLRFSLAFFESYFGTRLNSRVVYLAVKKNVRVLSKGVTSLDCTHSLVISFVPYIIWATNI
ncbi:hypothetical protein BpHYR1_018837 [Brachionus plicatilis]|uniref:Uncharacterized protein n=1 Tax=Brachionus plicatilis TaxID=10195 RepID=A0A3M7QR10_BRAPC|nr:hypothetical protein BpHYR1_018837 [Brachionus plicatilis]